MKKSNVIFGIIIAVISIAIVALINMYLLNTKGRLNQGSFRINDAVLNSNVDIVEKQEETDITQLSNMVFDISQNNTLSLLITKNMQIKSMYLNKIEAKLPTKLGKLEIFQVGKENDKVEVTNKDTQINIYPSEKDEQYYTQIAINNTNCLKDVNVPNDTKVVKFDGTVLELLNQKISDFYFDLSFNLVIEDVTGKKYISRIKLNMPTEELIQNGISITRLDTSLFNFVIK